MPIHTLGGSHTLVAPRYLDSPSLAVDRENKIGRIVAMAPIDIMPVSAKMVR